MAKEKDVTAVPLSSEVTGEKTRTQELQSIKAQLDAQPKFRVRLPAARKGDAPFEVVGINGYNIQIKKGETVEIPESVYMILQEAQLV